MDTGLVLVLAPAGIAALAAAIVYVYRSRGK